MRESLFMVIGPVLGIAHAHAHDKWIVVRANNGLGWINPKAFG